MRPFGLRCLCVVTLAASIAAPARAHHTVSDYGIAGAEPRTVVELDTQAAAYDFDGRSGSWQLAAPTVEYAVVERLSAAARVPFARVAPDDGDAVVGLSDVALSLKLLVARTMDQRFALSLGLGLELPTGDADRGLGNGHYELNPFVAASFALTTSPDHPFFIYGVVADRASLGEAAFGGHDDGADHDHTPHGSVISPHAKNELSTRVLVAYAPHPFYASAGVEAVHVLAGEGAGPWVARGELGWLFGSDWRLAAGLDVPFAGDRRFDWRARLGVARTFR